MRTIVGFRPSGRLHLGHYASVIKPAIEHGADILLARFHAPEATWQDLEDAREILGAFGLEKQIVTQHTDMLLFAKLLNATPSHLLNAMPQYKAKEKTALMYVYPVLMALDIADYDRVIVGEDQRPHIEFAKDILPRVGLKCPEPIYTGAKIMDLRHPENKMSKSDPNSCLFLDDKDYERKIMKAVTDEAGRANLENIYVLLGGKDAQMDNRHLKQEIIQLYERQVLVLQQTDRNKHRKIKTPQDYN